MRIHLEVCLDASELFQAKQGSTNCGAGPTNAYLMWLGLLRTGEGVSDFIWADYILAVNTPFSFTNWASGEPSFTDNHESCVAMHTDGAWEDVQCGNSETSVLNRIWMCEKPANVGKSG